MKKADKFRADVDVGLEIHLHFLVPMCLGQGEDILFQILVGVTVTLNVEIQNTR